MQFLDLVFCAVLVVQGIRATGFTSFSHFKSANFESANTFSKYDSKATLPILFGFRLEEMLLYAHFRNKNAQNKIEDFC